MSGLIESCHAYTAGGDVYFDVCSYPRYGDLVSGSASITWSAANDTRFPTQPIGIP